MTRRALPAFLPLPGFLALALGAAACNDDGAPAEPVPGVVLLDTTSTIEAVAGARDTIRVTVPPDRTMGVIFESDVRIAGRYGPGLFDVVFSGYGGAFGAIVPQVGQGDVRLIVQRVEPEIVRADYRMRIVAVDESPEHTDGHIEPGSGFHREWIDPPLDLDVFAVDFDDGDRFFLEMEGDEEAEITVGVLPPEGASFYAFLAAGPERARSAVFETVETGPHLVVVYSRGLTPDTELSYRIRVVQTDEPSTTILR